MSHQRTILLAATALALAVGTTPVSAQGLSVGGSANVDAGAGVKGALPSAPAAGADVNAGAGAGADVDAGAGGASADVQGSADADVDTEAGGAGAELNGKGNVGGAADIE